MNNGRTFRQILALLLCFAMILPNFTGLVSAASTGDNSTSSQSTDTTSKVEFDTDTLNSWRIPMVQCRIGWSTTAAMAL